MMTKAQLSTLLHTLDIPVGEGEQFLDSADSMPKVAYWEYVWSDVMASGDDYDTVITYQISLVSRRPRDPSLVALKQALNDAGVHPDIYLEYVKGDNAPGYFHAYCSIEVEEEIEVVSSGGETA